MKRTNWIARVCFILLFVLTHYQGYAQSVITKPYLQFAESTSIKVMWETSSGTDSQVSYGLTSALGNLVNGTSVTGNGTSRIHTVQLSNLSPNTKYYYQAKTNNYSSSIHEFVTPPSAGADKVFTMVALSDMQSHNTTYGKIIRDGIIKYSADHMTGNVAKDISLLIAPGDLVGEGYDYSQWSDDFFQPAEQLYSDIPVYPSIGNHDIWEKGGNDNSSIDPKIRIGNYKKYFDLPLNGTAGSLEEWWYLDYGNVRLIGLNSEFNDDQVQLNWFKQVLDDAKNNTNIDFVFAQMHHPHKSEMWNVTKPFSTSVVNLLEDFTAASGKPSVQFFGHTHGYSRGQLRDNEVAMINVGCGGGRLDNWNENWPRKDYEEFSVSQDEFGFVLVEVTAGLSPKITVKKMGMGNEDLVTPYVLRDEFVVKKVNQKPVTPTCISPVGSSNSLVLKGSAFVDPDNDGFGSAHFQLSSSMTFTNLIVDNWKQHENWYMGANTQANDDLTDVTVGNLTLGNTYYWRVRYRDKALGWSEWSTPATFNYTNNVNNNPIANFSSNQSVISEGESVVFSDLSVNNPTSWLWTFEGGVPATSTIKSPVVQYPTSGSYKVTLKVTNQYGTNTKEVSKYITVSKPSVAGDTVAFYTFENNVEDVSGNERHGEASAVNFVNDVDRGWVADFSNSSYSDIQIGTSASVGLPIKDMTVAAWVKADAFDAWGGFVGSFQDNGADESGWVLGSKDQRFSIAMTTIGNPMTYLIDNADYQLGEWYHVAATYDGLILRLYVDGEQKVSSTAQSGNINYPLSGWHTIGRYKDDNEDDGYDGMLDDVLILKTALSEGEIKKMYEGGIVTGIDLLDENNISPLAIPNPFDQSIIVGNNLSGELFLEIYDQLAIKSTLKAYISAGDRVDLSHLSTGVYVLKVITKKGDVYTEKIVKK